MGVVCAVALEVNLVKPRGITRPEHLSAALEHMIYVNLLNSSQG